MRKVCVITGGGSGMGLATAHVLGKDHFIVITGRTVAKLEDAITELRTNGIEAEAFACDVSDRDSVEALVKFARQKGDISTVIHAAGVSPKMASARKIMEVNALGTMNVTNAFYDVLPSGSCIVNVSSMAGHLVPKILIPYSIYKCSRKDVDQFIRRIMFFVNLFPKRLRAEISYPISKNFATWFSITEATRFGTKNVRIISVSPGMFQTAMGDLEKDEAEKYVQRYGAIKRIGMPEEIADLFAFVASSKAGYLTGVDILCDGGCVAGKK